MVTWRIAIECAQFAFLFCGIFCMNFGCSKSFAFLLEGERTLLPSSRYIQTWECWILYKHYKVYHWINYIRFKTEKIDENQRSVYSSIVTFFLFYVIENSSRASKNIFLKLSKEKSNLYSRADAKHLSQSCILLFLI